MVRRTLPVATNFYRNQNVNSRRNENVPILADVLKLKFRKTRNRAMRRLECRIPESAFNAHLAKRLPANACTDARAPHTHFLLVHQGDKGLTAVNDLVRWTQTLAATGAVLHRTSRELLASPQIRIRSEGDVDVAYGFGVRVYTQSGRVTELMHSGSGDEGHTSIVRILPALTVIVLSDSGLHAGITWSSYIAHLLGY